MLGSSSPGLPGRCVEVVRPGVVVHLGPPGRKRRDHRLFGDPHEPPLALGHHPQVLGHRVHLHPRGGGLRCHRVLQPLEQLFVVLRAEPPGGHREPRVGKSREPNRFGAAVCIGCEEGHSPGRTGGPIGLRWCRDLCRMAFHGGPPSRDIPQGTGI
eukprot:1952798-Pyramimonas_sp.AAC.1